MAPLEIIGLMTAAVAAGAINAVAGGGTLVSFPTLIFFGTPPVVANATSTFALFAGTAGSIYGYRKHLASVKPWLWRFVPVSIIGGLIGSKLLTSTSDRTFSKLVPFLILFATILLVTQGLFKRFAGMDANQPHEKHRHIWIAIFFQFLVGIYGGYFGAGIGILMLASLGFIGLSNIYEMNTLKTLLSSLINCTATIWFIGAGLVDWPRAGLMTGGALVGYYLGSHFSQKISPQTVRRVITAIGFILSGVTFYKEFLR